MPQRIEIGMPPAGSVVMADANGSIDPDWSWNGTAWLVGLRSSSPHPVAQVEWDRTVGAGIVRPIGAAGGVFDGIYYDNGQKAWFRPDAGTTVKTAGAPVVTALATTTQPTAVTVQPVGPGGPAGRPVEGGNGMLGLSIGNGNFHISLDGLVKYAVAAYDALAPLPDAPPTKDANGTALSVQAQLAAQSTYIGAVEERKHMVKQLRFGADTLLGALKVVGGAIKVQ